MTTNTKAMTDEQESILRLLEGLSIQREPERFYNPIAIAMLEDIADRLRAEFTRPLTDAELKALLDGDERVERRNCHHFVGYAHYRITHDTINNVFVHRPKTFWQKIFGRFNTE